MDGIYTTEDFLQYLVFCLVVLTILAPIAIVGWGLVIWGVLELVGIKVRESFREISTNKVILVSVFMLSTAYIMGSVFSRFV